MFRNHHDRMKKRRVRQAATNTVEIQRLKHRRKNSSELFLPAFATLKAALNTRQSQVEDECNLQGEIIPKKL